MNTTTTELVPTTILITGMTCGHCVKAVERALGGVPGIRVDRVEVGAAKVWSVTGAEGVSKALAAIQDAGYGARVDDARTEPRGGSCGCCGCGSKPA